MGAHLGPASLLVRNPGARAGRRFRPSPLSPRTRAMADCHWGLLKRVAFQAAWANTHWASQGERCAFALTMPDIGQLLAVDLDGNAGPAMYEVRERALRLADHLNSTKSRENLFPQDFQLKLGQTIAHAAMNPKAKR